MRPYDHVLVKEMEGKLAGNFQQVFQKGTSSKSFKRRGRCFLSLFLLSFVLIKRKKEKKEWRKEKKGGKKEKIARIEVVILVHELPQ